MCKTAGLKKVRCLSTCALERKKGAAMRTRNWMWLAICGLVLALSSMPAMAQNGGGGGGGGGKGGRSGRGNFDPAAMQAQMMTRIKDQLGATDDEWKVLQPKVEKVMTASREARFGGMGAMFGGGRGQGGPGGGGGGAAATDRPQTAIGKAAADLRSALEDKSIGAEEIANRLKVLRDAKQKAKEEYEA